MTEFHLETLVHEWFSTQNVPKNILDGFINVLKMRLARVSPGDLLMEAIYSDPQESEDIKPSKELLLTGQVQALSLLYDRDCKEFKKLLTQRDEEICRLREALAKAPEASEWQPIETAPKDRDVIVYCQNTGECFVAYALEDLWCYARSRSGAYICAKPSHWMPLPALPSAALSSQHSKE